MTQYELIERIKDELIKELDGLLGHFNLNKLPDLAETLEKVLVFSLGDILKKYSNEFLGLNFNEQSEYLVSPQNSDLFSINIGRDYSNSKFLNVVINHHSIGERPKLTNFHIGINGYGHIQKVRLLYPEALKFDLVVFNSLVKNIYEVGYNWFQLKIEELVGQEEISLISELYGYTKKVFPSKDLRKHLWFASVTKDYGFRLLEKDVAVDLFQRIKPNAEYYGHSTNRLVAEMVSTRLPRQKLLMQKAIEANQIMDVDIKQAKYSKEGSIYSAAMSSFYGCDSSFTIHPILIDSKANVVALYPSNMRSELEYALSKHANELIKICNNATSRIYQVEKLFEGKKTNVGKWGEFVGGFVKAFTDM